MSTKSISANVAALEELPTDDDDSFDPTPINWCEYDLELIDRATTYTYKRPDALYYCYHIEGESLREIGSRFGVSGETIRRQMEDHGIERRSRGRRRGVGNYYLAPVGEEWPRYCGGYYGETVRVHQLVACVENDPHEVFGDGTHVHHITGVPCLNTTDHVELVKDSDHGHIHGNGEYVEGDDGLPRVAVCKTDDEMGGTDNASET